MAIIMSSIDSLNLPDDQHNRVRKAVNDGLQSFANIAKDMVDSGDSSFNEEALDLLDKIHRKVE